MNRPQIIDFLTKNTFGELFEKHGVKSRPNATFTKFSLNYDQLKADNGELISQECRGMIVRPRWDGTVEPSDSNYMSLRMSHVDVVAWPMNRFFNHGQQEAKEIDWSSAEVYNKLDGTMCVVYHDPDPTVNMWCVATRSVCEADIKIDSCYEDLTFRTLFEKAVTQTTENYTNSGKLSFTEFTEKLDKTLTYVFELTTPINRIVVKYNDYLVRLLAVRSMSNYSEIKIKKLEHEYKSFMLFCPRYNLTTVEDAIEYANSRDYISHEGVVVVDEKFNRIKIKNPEYVYASKIRDSVSSSKRNIVKLILANKIDDIMQDLDGELLQTVTDIRDYMRTLFSDIDKNFCIINSKHKDDRKQFAMEVKDLPFKQVYFCMFSKKFKSSFDYYEDLNSKNNVTNSVVDNILKSFVTQS